MVFGYLDVVSANYPNSDPHMAWCFCLILKWPLVSPSKLLSLCLTCKYSWLVDASASVFIPHLHHTPHWSSLPHIHAPLPLAICSSSSVRVVDVVCRPRWTTISSFCIWVCPPLLLSNHWRDWYADTGTLSMQVPANNFSPGSGPSSPYTPPPVSTCHLKGPRLAAPDSTDFLFHRAQRPSPWHHTCGLKGPSHLHLWLERKQTKTDTWLVWMWEWQDNPQQR